MPRNKPSNGNIRRKIALEFYQKDLASQNLDTLRDNKANVTYF